ncbi:hypothetical protein C8Q77DRAFT_416014 [Trametes polyzona]|nr:hypothetical protein C8Q77DRAFT_416014 [Trametes polyzona]
MSHLTAPMPTGQQPHKSYLFDFPRPAHPLTPPDTDYEALSHQAPPAQNMAGLETEPFPPQQPPSVIDSPFATLHRKRSSVTYVNSGIRDSRERVVQRGIKWLVVVLPPVSFTREHGHLGHTLSSGPTRRLSNGLLMPLYPTLNSQLGAIAREFSFPSITGICVYLHTTHGGLSLSPRVSDESWPILWGHLFDARSPSLPPQQLPISGQIEFDIDLSKARWYDAWLSSSRRDYVDVPQSVTPSRAHSISHWRGDSQTSINEPLDDQADAVSVVQPARNSGRNIKKLSLLDRFDGASVRSGSKLVPRDESPPSQTARQAVALQALSPIVQEDEPATAKKEFDSRVMSWRLSATAAARSPLAATGQTSLDPANMPNTMADLPTASTTELQSELNLDDYDWSVSSVGPPDYDLQSLASYGRVPSVHMDRRHQGSVCLTPSICTSFGPDDDYFPFSPISYMDRLPSPDLAWRMIEDAPPTPSTATSWGAPLSFPPSPLSSPYAPSIDIAARCLSSRPVTPSTATSWGAPLSFPPSPVMPYRAPSPDLGERGMSSVPSSPVFRRVAAAAAVASEPAAEPFGLVYPYYNAARASSWQHVWPYTESQEAQEQVAEPREAVRMQGFVFPPPAASHSQAAPWKQVWPYAASSAESEVHALEPVRVSLGYPVLDIYPAAYPSFDIYPSVSAVDDRKLPLPVMLPDAAYPVLDIYPAVYPSFDIYPSILSLDERKLGHPAVSSGAAYPIFDLYPAVYPSFDIYPATLNVPGSEESHVSAYTSGYPYFDIYPAVSNASSGTTTVTSTISLRLTAQYPIFNIYPAVYPYCFDEIYPAAGLGSGERSLTIHDGYPYSVYNIYPAISSVPQRRLEAVVVGVYSHYPVLEIYPPISKARRGVSESGVVVKLPITYPNFDIYPAVYPWSLPTVYPQAHDRALQQTSKGSVVVKLEAAYPAFDIYPAVYPYSLFSVYPAVVLSPVAHTRVSAVTSTKPPSALRPSARSTHIRKTSLKRGLPPVPPLPKNARELTPFSPVSRRPLPLARVEVSVPVHLDAVYPNVCPYPPVYPHLSVYPDVSAGTLAIVDVRSNASLPPVFHYPYLDIYPAVYPHLSIYPRASGSMASIEHVHISAGCISNYPHLVIYPSVYPFIEIYPGSWDNVPVSAPTAAATRRAPKYTHMQLREQVLATAPVPVAPVATAVPPRKRPTFSHMQLREEVFAAQRAAKERELPKVIVAEPSPATPDLFSPPEPEFEIITPTVRSAAPAVSRAPFSPPEPEFEIIAAPAPVPVSAAPRVPPTPPTGLTRSRSGTVSSRPPMPPPPRPLGTRPSMQSIPSPVGPSDAPPAPSPSRSLNRLSGLPAHPAANRRISSAAPRPMSTFGPLPAVPEPTPGPSPVARRQRTMMSPLDEERPSPISRSPQMPSPPDDWQRSHRTPSDTSPTSRLPGMGSSGLSRSNTMPTRAAPRGPRSSTLISERARLFTASNGIGAPAIEEDSPTKLMSTLAEFPTPPRPPMPSSPSRPVVSKLDRSKYPFA